MSLRCLLLFLAFFSTFTVTSCSSGPSVEVKPADSDLDDLDAPGVPTNVGEGPEDDMDEVEFPSQNRYQVVQRGFDRSTLMPLLTDFDALDDPSPKLNCLSVKASDPNTMSEMVIKQMMVAQKGMADFGPLFPGSMDHSDARLVIGRNNGWVNSVNLTNEIRQVFDLARAPGALVIRINENKFGIYQDIGAPAEVWIRKNVLGHIFFKVFRVTQDHTRNEVFIGYCFERGNFVKPRSKSRGLKIGN